MAEPKSVRIFGAHPRDPIDHPSANPLRFGINAGGTSPRSRAPAMCRINRGYCNNSFQPTSAADSSTSSNNTDANPAATRLRFQMTINRTTGIANWNLNVPNASQQPHKKSACCLSATKAKVNSNRRRIESCPWSKLRKVGKNARKPRRNSHTGIVLEALRCGRKSKATHRSAIKLNKFHTTNAWV